MILRAGEFIFHEHYVSFHLHRDNIYSPWRVIGVYDAYGKLAVAKYVEDFRYIEDSFKEEVASAGSLSGTQEFLEKWRKKRNINQNSALTKIIKYYSTSKDTYSNGKDIYRYYVGSYKPEIIAKIGIMVRSREAYFPLVFANGAKNKKRDEVVAAIKKAGLYDDRKMLEV